MTLAQLSYRSIPYILAVAWGYIISIWVVFGLMD